MKSAFITLIGRPSSGKSTLMNSVCGHKISITAPSPQTTRNRVRGILSTVEGQLVFVDTPGFHDSDKKLNLQLKEVSVSALEETDLILYVVDISRDYGEESRQLETVLDRFQDKLVVVLNKSDLAEGQNTETEQIIRARFPGAQIFRISAAEKTGLEPLVAELYAKAPEGEQFYPDEFVTDQDPEFRISEIIREKAINLVKDELPHAIYVEIADMEMTEDDSMLWVRAFITVEKESQKGIVVGKGGTVIRKIRQAAWKELTDIFPYKINLDLRVKVNSRWRRNDSILRKLIY